jgi:hypothetical protein
MTYAQILAKLALLNLEKKEPIEGQLPENSVKKEGFCEGRQYWFVLCVEEDIL